MIIGLVAVIATFVCVPLIRIVGKRNLYLICTVGVVLSMSSLGKIHPIEPCLISLNCSRFIDGDSCHFSCLWIFVSASKYQILSKHKDELSERTIRCSVGIILHITIFYHWNNDGNTDDAR